MFKHFSDYGDPLDAGDLNTLISSFDLVIERAGLTWTELTYPNPNVDARIEFHKALHSLKLKTTYEDVGLPDVISLRPTDPSVFGHPVPLANTVYTFLNKYDRVGTLSVDLDGVNAYPIAYTPGELKSGRLVDIYFDVLDNTFKVVVVSQVLSLVESAKLGIYKGKVAEVDATILELTNNPVSASTLSDIENSIIASRSSGIDTVLNTLNALALLVSPESIIGLTENFRDVLMAQKLNTFNTRLTSYVNLTSGNVGIMDTLDGLLETAYSYLNNAYKLEVSSLNIIVNKVVPVGDVIDFKSVVHPVVKYGATGQLLTNLPLLGTTLDERPLTGGLFRMTINTLTTGSADTPFTVNGVSVTFDTDKTYHVGAEAVLEYKNGIYVTVTETYPNPIVNTSATNIKYVMDSTMTVNQFKVIPLGDGSVIVRSNYQDLESLVNTYNYIDYNTNEPFELDSITNLIGSLNSVLASSVTPTSLTLTESHILTVGDNAFQAVYVSNIDKTYAIGDTLVFQFDSEMGKLRIIEPTIVHEVLDVSDKLISDVSTLATNYATVDATLADSFPRLNRSVDIQAKLTAGILRLIESTDETIGYLTPLLVDNRIRSQTIITMSGVPTTSTSILSVSIGKSDTGVPHKYTLTEDLTLESGANVTVGGDTINSILDHTFLTGESFVMVYSGIPNTYELVEPINHSSAEAIVIDIVSKTDQYMSDMLNPESKLRDLKYGVNGELVSLNLLSGQNTIGEGVQLSRHVVSNVSDGIIKVSHNVDINFAVGDNMVTSLPLSTIGELKDSKLINYFGGDINSLSSLNLIYSGGQLVDDMSLSYNGTLYTLGVPFDISNITIGDKLYLSRSEPYKFDITSIHPVTYPNITSEVAIIIPRYTEFYMSVTNSEYTLMMPKWYNDYDTMADTKLTVINDNIFSELKTEWQRTIDFVSDYNNVSDVHLFDKFTNNSVTFTISNGLITNSVGDTSGDYSKVSLSEATNNISSGSSFTGSGLPTYHYPKDTLPSDHKYHLFKLIGTDYYWMASSVSSVISPLDLLFDVHTYDKVTALEIDYRVVKNLIYITMTSSVEPFTVVEVPFQPINVTSNRHIDLGVVGDIIMILNELDVDVTFPLSSITGMAAAIGSVTISPGEVYGFNQISNTVYPNIDFGNNSLLLHILRQLKLSEGIHSPTEVSLMNGLISKIIQYNGTYNQSSSTVSYTLADVNVLNATFTSLENAVSVNISNMQSIINLLTSRNEKLNAGYGNTALVQELAVVNDYRAQLVTILANLKKDHVISHTEGIVAVSEAHFIHPTSISKATHRTLKYTNEYTMEDASGEEKVLINTGSTFSTSISPSSNAYYQGSAYIIIAREDINSRIPMADGITIYLGDNDTTNSAYGLQYNKSQYGAKAGGKMKMIGHLEYPFAGSTVSDGGRFPSLHSCVAKGTSLNKTSKSVGLNLDVNNAIARDPFGVTLSLHPNPISLTDMYDNGMGLYTVYVEDMIDFAKSVRFRVIERSPHNRSYVTTYGVSLPTPLESIPKLLMIYNEYGQVMVDLTSSTIPVTGGVYKLIKDSGTGEVDFALNTDDVTGLVSRSSRTTEHRNGVYIGTYSDGGVIVIEMGCSGLPVGGTILRISYAASGIHTTHTIRLVYADGENMDIPVTRVGDSLIGRDMILLEPNGTGGWQIRPILSSLERPFLMSKNQRTPGVGDEGTGYQLVVNNFLDKTGFPDITMLPPSKAFENVEYIDGVTRLGITANLVVYDSKHYYMIVTRDFVNTFYSLHHLNIADRKSVKIQYYNRLSVGVTFEGYTTWYKY